MEEFVSDFSLNQDVNISFVGFVINILGTAILSVLLGKLYIRYGSSFSNRKELSRNFLLLSLVTMLVITVVKSSLALSLGLVGALSIVRFRTAIKEPEELMYLFFCIAIGLGFGADQRLITIVAFVLISLLVILFRRKEIVEENGKGLLLKVQSSGSGKLSFDEVTKILSEFCVTADLRRLEESKELVEVSFLIEIDSFDAIREIKEKLVEKDEFVTLRILDNKGIVSI